MAHWGNFSKQADRREIMPIQHPSQSSSNLLEVLEKILDKGVVIAGDIKISLADVDLLTIKIRLLIASVDKAREIGMDWWETDSYYSSKARIAEKENILLHERINRLEQIVEEKTLRLEGDEKAFIEPIDEKVLHQLVEKKAVPPHVEEKEFLQLNEEKPLQMLEEEQELLTQEKKTDVIQEGKKKSSNIKKEEKKKHPGKH